MMILWLLLAASLGGAIGLFAASLLAAGARGDLALDLARERSKVALAHLVGDLMCAQLAEFLKRKDLSVKTRHYIGDLLYRWGALRPATTTNAPHPVTLTGPVPLNVPSVWIGPMGGSLESGVTAKGCVGAAAVTDEPEFVGAPAAENGQRTGEEVL